MGAAMAATAVTLVVAGLMTCARGPIAIGVAVVAGAAAITVALAVALAVPIAAPFAVAMARVEGPVAVARARMTIRAMITLQTGAGFAALGTAIAAVVSEIVGAIAVVVRAIAAIGVAMARGASALVPVWPLFGVPGPVERLAATVALRLPVAAAPRALTLRRATKILAVAVLVIAVRALLDAAMAATVAAVVATCVVAPCETLIGALMTMLATGLGRAIAALAGATIVEAATLAGAFARTARLAAALAIAADRTGTAIRPG